jgi:hypothetical protein
MAEIRSLITDLDNGGTRAAADMLATAGWVVDRKVKGGVSVMELRIPEDDDLMIETLAYWCGMIAPAAAARGIMTLAQSVSGSDSK